MRAALLSQEDGLNLAISKFNERLISKSNEKIPSIIEKARLLKGTSFIKTNYEFHDRILTGNIKTIKHLLYHEIEDVCLFYLDSYTDINKEEQKNSGNAVSDAEVLLEIPHADFEDETSKIRDFKIRSYKELNNIAIEKGFEFARHRIYRNLNGYIDSDPAENNRERLTDSNIETNW